MTEKAQSCCNLQIFFEKYNKHMVISIQDKKCLTQYFQKSKQQSSNERDTGQDGILSAFADMCVCDTTQSREFSQANTINKSRPK